MTDNDNLELKKRSRRRLVGAGALALVAAIVLPVVMDEEPGVVIQDIQVSIPDRDADSKPIGGRSLVVEPLIVPAPLEQPGGIAEGEIEPIPSDPVVVVPPRTQPPPVPVEPPTATRETRPPPRESVARPAAPEGDEAARVREILEGRMAAAAAQGDRSFVVQVGAFGETSKAAAMSSELEAKGFKSFTEDAGAVTRVRVGPFASRSEAEKVAEKLRSLGIGGVVTTR